MLATVLAKTVHDQRRALVGWGAGIVVTVALMAAMWPTVRDMFDSDLWEAYPDVMRDLFDLESMGTGAGFFNVELFSIVLPGMFIAYGVGRGARLVAGEEADGTLEMVIVSPVSRTRVLVDKAVGLAGGLGVLGVVLFVSVVVASWVMDMGIPVGHAAIGALAMVLVGAMHAAVALAVGAATGRRALAIAAAGVVAVAGYVLHVMGALVAAIEPWRPLSPFTQAIDAGPISGTFPAGFAALAVVTVVLVAAALVPFDRRDLRTG